jgi:hypothetical protein
VKDAPSAPLTPEQKLAILQKTPIGDVGASYLKVRDRKRALENAAEELGKELALFDQVILAYLAKEKATGFTANGMVIGKYTLTTAKITDPEEVRQFVLANPEEHLELLEMKASKSGMKNYQEKHATLGENDEVILGELPPGMVYNEFLKVGVRKK